MEPFVTAAVTAPASKYFSKLANARVLVVGGSSGIGRAVAEAAVEHGAIVTIASSNKDKLAAVEAKFNERYPDRKEYVSTHVCDLSQKDKLESNIEPMLAHAARAGPAGVDIPNGVDHVVFTAGDWMDLVPLADITVGHIEHIATVRHYGALILAKLCLKYMKKSASSSFTLTGGSNSTKPMAGLGIFAIIGKGIEGLKNGLTMDLKPIRVNMVSPGAVPTEFWDKPMFAGAQETARQQTTTETLGTPEDMADAYLYLMKDKFVAGVNIDTNGGSFFV